MGKNWVWVQKILTTHLISLIDWNYVDSYIQLGEDTHSSQAQNDHVLNRKANLNKLKLVRERDTTFLDRSQ